MTDIGAALFNEWQESGLTKTQVAAKHGLTYGQAAGKIWRYQQEQKQADLVRFAGHYKPLGEAWHLHLDNFIAAADMQIPTCQELWVDLLCMTAQRHLKRPRHLILAGDLLNMDAFSGYDPDHDEPSLADEVEAAQGFFKQVLRYFDEIHWFWGNHERRATRKTKGALKPYLLGQLVLGSLMHLGKVKLSHWGVCAG